MVVPSIGIPQNCKWSALNRSDWGMLPTEVGTSAFIRPTIFDNRALSTRSGKTPLNFATHTAKWHCKIDSYDEEGEEKDGR